VKWSSPVGGGLYVAEGGMGAVIEYLPAKDECAFNGAGWYMTEGWTNEDTLWFPSLKAAKAAASPAPAWWAKI